MMTPEQSEQAAESLLDQRCRRRSYDNCCAGLPGKHIYLFAGWRRSWWSFWIGGTQRLIN